MVNLRRVRDAVALSWVEHQVELLAGFLEFENELRRVLHMDVVVHHSVDQQQPAVEVLCGSQDRGTFVACAVVLRRQHIAFGVDGIVE